MVCRHAPAPTPTHLDRIYLPLCHLYMHNKWQLQQLLSRLSCSSLRLNEPLEAHNDDVETVSAVRDQQTSGRDFKAVVDPCRWRGGGGEGGDVPVVSFFGECWGREGEGGGRGLTVPRGFPLRLSVEGDGRGWCGGGYSSSPCPLADCSPCPYPCASPSHCCSPSLYPFLSPLPSPPSPGLLHPIPFPLLSFPPPSAHPLPKFTTPSLPSPSSQNDLERKPNVPFPAIPCAAPRPPRHVVPERVTGQREAWRGGRCARRRGVNVG